MTGQKQGGRFVSEVEGEECIGNGVVLPLVVHSGGIRAGVPRKR